MQYGSVCSGIEAASVAWHPLGWRAAWFAEIEKFPAAVLAHHYPSTQNLGDMTQIARQVLIGAVSAPDVLVGGTPCQAFSVAGMRAGLADPRGALTIKFVELADAIDHVRVARGDDEAIIVWENVPGVLSDRGNAFGCFLGALAGEDCELQPSGGKWSDAGCVYGPARAIAWRILDAQYFGLAQRRRRVFVVASARNGFDPAAVLFEREGVRRDTSPSRGEREKIASTLDASFGRLQGCSGQDANHGHSHLVFGGNNTSGPIDVAPARNASASASGRLDFEPEAFVVHGTQDPCVQDDMAFALDRNNGRENAVCVTGEITHTLKAEGFDASEDGTGRGQPIVPVMPPLSHDTLHNKGFMQGVSHASTEETDTGKVLRALLEAIGAEAFTQWGLGVLDSLQSPEVLRQDVHGRRIRCQTCEEKSRMDDGAPSCEEASAAGAVCEMRKAGRERRSPQGRQLAEQLSKQLGAHLQELSRPRASAKTFLLGMWEASEGLWLLRQALSAIQEVGRPAHDQAKPALASASVRRLTPRETERLQGFPDDYTLIPWRGKPASDCPDGPRYKAIGNSMAVPCMRWIAMRIENHLEQRA